MKCTQQYWILIINYELLKYSVTAAEVLSHRSEYTLT